MTMNVNPHDAAPEVVIVGGGIAALELVLALRQLAGDHLRMTLVAAQPDFVLRPMLVAEALGRRAPERRPLSKIADDLGVRLVQAAVTSVDTERRRVVLRSGDTLPYDSLVLAHGTRTIPAYDGVIELGGTVQSQEIRSLRDEIGAGQVRSVAFVAPTRTGWLLPLYEAALMTANSGHSIRVTLVTREAQPLEMFGAEASATVAAALETAGIEFIGAQIVTVADGTVQLTRHPLGSLSVDRIVALPLVRGLRVPGIPTTGLFGLIGVDVYGRVKGLTDVYAAGDATDYPVKQGDIACQQADAVASAIASRHGGATPASPFQPVLRATLLTGTGASIALGPGAGADELGKLPGRYLARYLRPEPIAA
jgi:sulfide:quinone oxidoreductase